MHSSDKYYRMRTLVIICFVFALCLNTVNSVLRAQTLASNNTRAQARYNKEKSYAAVQRTVFNITSWAGANISDLVAKWGNFTKVNELSRGIMVYSFEHTYSGSGGSYRAGFLVTDQFGNVVEQKAAKDNTYSYSFTEYYEFYVDINHIIVHVKAGTR